MNQRSSKHASQGSISTWAILFTLLVTILWTLWGWGLRGAADGPMPPVRDIGAVELPLVPTAEGAEPGIQPGMPLEKARPRPVFAVHRVGIDPRAPDETRFPVA